MECEGLDPALSTGNAQASRSQGEAVSVRQSGVEPPHSKWNHGHHKLGAHPRS